MPQLPNLRAKLTGWYTYHQLCYCLEDEKQHRHIYPLTLVMLFGQRKHQTESCADWGPVDASIVSRPG
jgi:hypothetical protein